MKEKRKEKLSSEHKKIKKKHKAYESSSDSDTSDDQKQWVEASPIHQKDKKIKKKKKKHKKIERSSSDSESDQGSMQWVEASSPKLGFKKKKKHAKKKKDSSTDSESSSHKHIFKTDSPLGPAEMRDSWMNEESFVPTLTKQEMYSSSRQKRADSAKEQREKEEKIQRERELNPHWKNEGTGLPEKEANVEDLSLPSTSVGDGGYSWLKKAYYRIQEQAQSEGRSMEDVAVQRWGSLSKLTSLIEKAEERMKSHPDWKHSKNQYQDKYRRENRYNRAQFKQPVSAHEPEKDFHTPFQFKKPEDNKSQKVINQFKSSRKSSNLDKKTEYETSHSSTDLPKQCSHFEKDFKKHSDYHIPAWKKPKYVAEKDECGEISRNSEDQLDKPPINKTNIGKSSTSEIDSVLVMHSADDLNKLAARQIKAEIMGNTSLAQELKKQLDEARSIVKEKGFTKQSCKKVEEVILTKLDDHGQARPIQTSGEKISDYKQKRSNKYFDDGSGHSLKQMFEREKMVTANDHLEMFVKASAQSNETAEIDYESGYISKKLGKNLSSSREEEKDIGKAIQQHQKHIASLEKCEYCLDQPRMKKYLIVDIGEQIYLCLPNFQTLTEGHCLIVPKCHVSSILSLEENEWSEINDFKSKLRRMFMSDKKSVIFLETSMNYRHFPHAFIECIPVPVEDGDMAPFYFKKAIQESETEWAHNKKLVDLTNKGLRHSVPKNLPYFHVEFDPNVHAGYAHVIEDEKYFPKNFGKEVVGGMLDINYNHLYKNKKEDPLKKSKEVVEFEKKLKLFKS